MCGSGVVARGAAEHGSDRWLRTATAASKTAALWRTRITTPTRRHDEMHPALHSTRTTGSSTKLTHTLPKRHPKLKHRTYATSQQNEVLAE